MGYTLTVMRRDQSGDFAPRGMPVGVDREGGPSRRGSLMVRPAMSTVLGVGLSSPGIFRGNRLLVAPGQLA